jgi:HPt (histidine-containing phosphotransfer) domain-containing protein
MASDPTPSSSSSPVDWTAVLASIDGDRALLHELILAFRQEAPTLMRGVAQAIEDRDARELHRQAHTLKGCVRFFGAAAALEVARQLEQAGREEQLSAAPVLLVTLRKEMATLQVALDAGPPSFPK